MLGSLRLVECADGRARVLVEDPSQREFAERRAGAITGMIREIVGGPVRLELQDASAPGSPTPRASTREQDRAALDHPLVRRTVELFEASVIAVEANAPSGDAAPAPREDTARPDTDLDEPDEGDDGV